LFVRVEEQVTIPAPVEEVWDFVWQTEQLAACVPGCTGVETLEPGKRYRATMSDHIGPYRIEAAMEIVIEEATAPEHIRMRASGKDNRLGATQRVALDIRLRPVSDAETILHAAGDVEVLGKVATLGQFAIKRKMNDIFKKFGANIRAHWAA
jgi:uncharacterized protein